MPSARSGHTSNRLRAEIAASVDLPVELTPWLSELFADLHSLGSSPRRIVSVLRSARLTPRSRVLDLACGKGAAAVAVAQAFGCRVLGVDACAPFIEAARESARRRGLDSWCEFRVGDVRRAPVAPFDLAMMLGLFGAPDAAPLLRRRVRAGGFYLIDDAFRDVRFTPMPRGLREVPSRKEMEALFASFGDEVVADDVPSPSRIQRLNQSLYRRLAARCRVLATSQPRLRSLLNEFLARQRRANTLLRGPLRPGLWLVRRGR